MENRLVVNADDLGFNKSCSEAIALAFEKKLISSTTAMANGEYIEQAYKLALEGGFCDKVGIHIVLTEGEPLTEGIKSDPFFCEGGVFHNRINRLKRTGKKEIEHLKEEVSAQIEKLRSLGFPLSHADSHHHIHTDVFFIGAIEEVLKKYGINKIRLHRNFGDMSFYKKIIKNMFNARLVRHGFVTVSKMGSLDDLENYPETIKEYPCEIMVHPDFDKDGRLVDRSLYADGVPVGEELEKISRYVRDTELVSYNELK